MAEMDEQGQKHCRDCLPSGGALGEGPIHLRPIGRVRSPIADPAAMPIWGVPAEVEVFPEYAEGLEAIETNTHIIVIGWLHQADRTQLRVHSRHSRPDQPPRGVFGLRSSIRPNPLALCVARLLRVEGPRLYLERLDLIDGTPVVDLKRYAVGWDCVFAARSSRELSFPHGHDAPETLRDMLNEAEHFHGERCAGLAIGVQIIYHAMRAWQVGPKDPALRLWLGQDGCIADALQALSGATWGNGRLKVGRGSAFRLAYGEEALTFTPRRPSAGDPEELLRADPQTLFTVRRR